MRLELKVDFENELRGDYKLIKVLDCYEDHETMSGYEIILIEVDKVDDIYQVIDGVNYKADTIDKGFVQSWAPL